jgi:hypothetical protein
VFLPVGLFDRGDTVVEWPVRSLLRFLFVSSVKAEALQMDRPRAYFDLPPLQGDRGLL